MKPVPLKYEHVSLRAEPDMCVQLLGSNFIYFFNLYNLLHEFKTDDIAVLSNNVHFVGLKLGR